MQMYPGAGYKEHDYKVEEEHYIFKDDFNFDKSSAMHMNKPKMADHPHHHHNNNNNGSNMHMMMKLDHCGPNNKHGYGDVYHGNNYDTIYVQEEKQFHVNKYDHVQHGGHAKPSNDHHKLSAMKNHYGGKKFEGGYNVEYDLYYSEERKNVPATWNCKGIDD